MNIVVMIIYQLLVIIGIFYLFGIVLWFIEKLIIHNLGYKANVLYKSTMIIGTSIHELSHALFCIIFKHKITNIKLFDLSAQDSTFGYVEHEYNSKNIYEKIGNFFIGIAPIVIGTIVINILLYILMNNTFDCIYNNTRYVDIKDIYKVLYIILKELFTKSNLSNWQLYIFLLISLPISLHLNISKEDLKGSLSGIIFVIVLIWLVDLICILFKISSIDKISDTFKYLLIYELSAFSIVFILVLIVMIISIFIRILKRLI